MKGIFLTLCVVLALMACGSKRETVAKNSVVVTVQCEHRTELLGRIPEGARDWSKTRDILVECLPLFDLPTTPRKHKVTFSSDGFYPRRLAVATHDIVEVINASHRPLTLTSLGSLNVNIHFNHGEIRHLTLEGLQKRDEIFDDSHARRLVIVSSRTPFSTHVDSHTPTTFSSLPPGSWILRLSHDLIPAEDIPMQVSAKGETRLTHRFSVGRLPLIR